MNEQVRQAVKKVMKERGVTQDALAKMIGVDRHNVNALLNGKTGKVPKRWQHILDALELKLDVKQNE